VETKTRNITPVNCFRYRLLQHFPAEVFPFVVLATLTDGMGGIPLELVIYRLDTFEPIYRKGTSFQFEHPLQELRCCFKIRKCLFPVPGYYEIVLLADNELVAHRRIRLVLKEDAA